MALISNLVIGLAVAALGFVFATDCGSTHRLAGVCPILGAWTIVALWAVTGATRTAGSILSNVIAGAVVLLCGLAILGIGTGGSPGRRHSVAADRHPAEAGNRNVPAGT